MEKFEWQKDISIQERLSIPSDVRLICPIGVDLILAGLNKEGNLPSDIASNPKLVKEASKRRELYSSLRVIFEKVKDENMNIDDAVENGLVNPADLVNVYKNLINFLESDENNSRILLYLPLQLLPNLYFKNLTDQLTEAKLRFKSVYQDAWIRLLFESEPRANFVDGDVLEPGLGEPERIRKAGHLISEILERGLIDSQDIIDLLDINEDEELLRSLAEGIIVARDKHLIDHIDWQRIKDVAKVNPVIFEILETSNDKNNNKESNNSDESESEKIISQLDHDLTEIDAKYAKNSLYVSTISQARARWEKGVKEDEAINRAAKEFAVRMQGDKLGKAEVEAFCQGQEFNEKHKKAVFRSIVKVAQSYVSDDLEKAQVFAGKYKDLTEELWDNGSIEIKDEIISGLSHLRRLDIIQDYDLEKFGITLPDLASPFPVNLEEVTNTDLKGLIEAVRKIKSHPTLSKDIYPFMLAFGSRFKGYAGLSADIDAAIFIKPDVPFEKREKTLHRLCQEVPELREIDKILEFWVKEENGKLGFRTNPEGVEKIAGDLQIHFLLGGVWVSKKQEYKKLYEDMLKKYLDLNRFGEQKEKVRSHLLGQIELDILQYRLMHKGYRRCYPNKLNSGTKHSHFIDWESDFWDPGYRRVATQLFLARVFLPDLT